MTAFRIVLGLIWLIIAGYTAITIAGHGINLFPDFFGDIQAMGWPGQFNIDFMSFLTLSALWLMWRHEFSPAGIGLGILGFFGGALFLSAYLLIISFRHNGDMRVILLGANRAAA